MAGTGMEGIGSRIRRLRKEGHFTQAEFAALFGVTHAHISAIEKGKNMPSEMFVMFICEKLHVNREWLQSGKGDMYRKQNFLQIVQITENGVEISRAGSYERMAYLISMAVEQFTREMEKGLADEIAKEMPGECPPTHYEVKCEIINQLIQAIEDYGCYD